jgi:hypothetical protein
MAMSGITPPKGVDASRASDNTPRESARDSPKGGANQDDSNRLARLLREDRSGGGGGSGDGRESRDDELPLSTDTPLSPAEAILASLGGFQPPPAPAPVETPQPTETITPVRGAELSELADKVAERVLTGTRADGEAEIRITLNSEMFGATEVSLAKHQGALELRIDTMSTEMRKLMEDNGANFATDLAKRLDMPVVVEVNAASRSDEAFRQGDQDNRRSRGYEQIVRYVAESRS